MDAGKDRDGALRNCPTVAGRAHTFSRALSANPQVETLLACPMIYRASGVSVFDLGSVPGFGRDPRPRPDDCVVGWGRKGNTRRATEFAKRHGLPMLRLEDGFIGFLGHPAQDPRRLSMVIDQTGIYYDASRPSDLEKILNDPAALSANLRSRAAAVLPRLRTIGVSKYNHAPHVLPDPVTQTQGEKILVVDQTYGDQSIRLGGAEPASFTTMLATARASHPNATVFLKVHPDVLFGRKRGHFDLNDLPPGVVPLADDVAPQTLLNAMDGVYVVTSQYGFDGLIAGVPVHVFGQPFYAGWGLTQDHVAQSGRRTATLDLVSLLAGALFAYPTYLDPYYDRVCSLERVLDYLEALKSMRRMTGRRLFPLEFSIWKRGFLRAFCRDAESYRPITKRALDVVKWSPGDVVLMWGRAAAPRISAEREAAQGNAEVWRVEDGFLRSSGLGSDLARPASLAIDGRGLYYDATRPSDLEVLLARHEFSAEQLARGRKLIARILETGVSKYNVGARADLDFRAHAGSRPVILVPGQVESDASLALGSPEVTTNTGLLEAVRRARPDAFIVYKPHPDVLARNRAAGAADKDGSSSLYDVRLDDHDIVTCFKAVDEVHVMTSLAGFEALLRGLPVTCYGLPFYAGWGLTDDRIRCERRGRALPLEALVYALLCLYSRHVAWPRGETTIPEVVIDTLAASSRTEAVMVNSVFSFVRNLLRKAGFFLKTFLS